MLAAGGEAPAIAENGLRFCLIRRPSDQEIEAVSRLYAKAKERFALDPARAASMATDPIGVIPEGGDPVEYAAWTVVANALLNLDEMFLKR